MRLIAAVLLLALVGEMMAFEVPLSRDPTKRRKAINQFFAKHPELKEEYANKKVPVADKERRAGKARAKKVEQLLARKEKVGAGFDEVPLLGPEYDLYEYYMEFYLGTPKAKFTAQVDTGSSDLSIPGIDCRKCGNGGDAPYDPSKSNTSDAISCMNPPDKIYCPDCDHGNCQYDISYEDGSGFTSDVYEDVYTMGQFKGYKQAFGTMVTESRNFEPKGIDGIIGFAFAALSEIEAATPVDGLYNSGQLAKNVFSMCTTDNGGAVNFGNDGGYYTGQMQYTPIVPYGRHYYWYQVEIEDMLVYNQSLGVSASTYNNGGSIVDSGTTDFLVPNQAYNAMFKAMQANCKHNNLVGVCGESFDDSIFGGYCYALTKSQLAAYPPIQISMKNNVNIEVPSKYYVVNNYCDDPDYYALAIDGLDKGEGTIMGDAVMKNYEVVHDRGNMQVGFGLQQGCPNS